MKTSRIASSVVLAACLLGGSARADQQWVADQLANGHRLTGLLQPLQLTEPFRLGDLPASCSGLQTDGSRNATCVTPLSITDPFAIVSNTLTLKFDGTLHIVGGQLSVVSAAPTGAATNDLGGSYPGPTVLAAEFGAQRLTFATTPDGSLLKRLGTTVAPAVDGTDFLSPSTGLLDPGANGYVLRTSLGHTSASATIPTSVFSGTLLAPQFPALTGPVTTTAGSLATSLNLGAGGVSGTLPAAQEPAHTGAVTNSAGSLAMAFGLQSALSAFGNWTNGSAVPTANVATVPLQVPQVNATGTAISWTNLTATSIGTISADWPIANTRWYCVDGSVSSPGVGFSDTSEADCGTKAVKTLAQLAAILPPGGGANHKILVAIADGTYTDPPTFLSMLGGYNPTAGGTQFVIPAQLAGGGSPSFPGEPGLPLGYRARFDGATATAANRNFATPISKVTSSQLEVGLKLPAADSTSDVFYIEQPGVIFTQRLFLAFIGDTGGIGHLQIAGITFGTSGNNSVAGGGAEVSFAFCTFSGSLLANDVWLFLAQSYADAGGTNRNVGGNVIPSGIVQLSFGVSLQVDGGYTQGAFVGNVQEFDTDYGAVFGGVSIRNFSLNNPATNLGNITSTTRAIRIISTVTDGITAGLVVQDGAAVSLGPVEFSGQGSSPAIALRNGSTLINKGGAGIANGTTGGSGVGLDLSGATGSLVVTPGGSPTITGSADVKLAGGSTISWASLATSGTYIDQAGNRIINGTTGTTLAGGALTVPALVGPGHVQVNSGGLTSVDTASYIAAPGSNGILVWTGSSTVARTLTSSAATITVTNGTGVGGNPNVDLPNVGPGATTTGTAGIASVTTDAQGRLLSAATATYLTGNQTITLTGPVTGSGATSIATSLATHGVAYGNIQQGAGLSVLGVTGPSTANLADIVATGGTQCLQTNSGGTAVVWAACPTSGGGGSVTNVSGTAGQVTVVNNTTTPVISLVAKGAGAGAYGGSGIAGFSLDGFGAVTSVTPATYLTSTGTTPGTYNQITDSSDGLITGASVTSWMTAGAIMKSGGLAALPVAAVAGTDYQAPLSFPSAGDVALSTGSGVTGDSHLTYDTSTHTLTSSVANVLGGSVQFPGAAGAGEVLAGISNTGFLEDVFPLGPGLSLGGGVLSVTFPHPQVAIPFYFNQSGLGAYGPQWLPTSNSLPNGNVNEYPPRFVVSSVEVVLNVVGVSWAGGQTFDIVVTRNGSAVSGSDVVFSSSPALGPHLGAIITVAGGAITDTFGLSITTTGGTGASLACTAELFLNP